MHDTHFTQQEEPLTNENRPEPPPHPAATGEVRAAIASRFTSATEPQTRLFWG